MDLGRSGLGDRTLTETVLELAWHGLQVTHAASAVRASFHGFGGLGVWGRKKKKNKEVQGQRKYNKNKKNGVEEIKKKTRVGTRKLTSSHLGTRVSTTGACLLLDVIRALAASSARDVGLGVAFTE